MSVDLAIQEILIPITSGGEKAFIVGGAVRDRILSRPVNDIDIATSASQEKIASMFCAAKAANSRHADIMSVRLSNGIKVEIAPYKRKALYIAGVPVAKMRGISLMEDLACRDFTANAMALDVNGRLIDPFDGKKDLDNGYLRAVGAPSDMLRSHPIRIMRAFRFASGLDLSLDGDLARAITKDGEMIVTEPWEAVGEEFRKGMAGSRPWDYASLLHYMDIMRYILPEVASLDGIDQNIHHKSDVLNHTIEALIVYSNALDRTDSSPDAAIAIAILLHDVGKPRTRSAAGGYGNTFHRHESVGEHIASEICKRFAFTQAMTRLIVAAVGLHMMIVETPRQASRFLSRIAATTDDREEIDRIARAALLVRYADALSRGAFDRVRQDKLVLDALRAEAALKVTDLAVNGNDVMETLGVGPGTHVGVALLRLLNAVQEGIVTNDHTTLLDVLENPKNYPAVYNQQDTRGADSVNEGGVTT